MNDNDYVKPDGSGVVQGDSRSMPTHDVGTMCGADCASDGCDLGPDATNRIGSIAGTSKSDPMEPA